MKPPNLTPALVRWYLNNGMTHRLAEAILVCRYLETLLAEIPVTQSGRIAPVFDYSQQVLREDWKRCVHFDLWLDGSTGFIVSTLPPSDGDVDLYHHHLPIDTQAGILFGRFAPLFR